MALPPALALSVAPPSSSLLAQASLNPRPSPTLLFCCSCSTARFWHVCTPHEPPTQPWRAAIPAAAARCLLLLPPAAVLPAQQPSPHGTAGGPSAHCVLCPPGWMPQVRQHSPDGTVEGFVKALQSHPEGPEGEAYRSARGVQSGGGGGGGGGLPQGLLCSYKAIFCICIACCGDMNAKRQNKMQLLPRGRLCFPSRRSRRCRCRQHVPLAVQPLKALSSCLAARAAHHILCTIRAPAAGGGCAWCCSH